MIFRIEFEMGPSFADQREVPRTMQTIVPTRGLPSIAAGLLKSPCGKVSFKFKRLHSVVSDAVYSWSLGRLGRAFCDWRASYSRKLSFCVYTSPLGLGIAPFSL